MSIDIISPLWLIRCYCIFATKLYRIANFWGRWLHVRMLADSTGNKILNLFEGAPQTLRNTSPGLKRLECEFSGLEDCQSHFVRQPHRSCSCSFVTVPSCQYKDPCIRLAPLFTFRRQSRSSVRRMASSVWTRNSRRRCCEMWASHLTRASLPSQHPSLVSLFQGTFSGFFSAPVHWLQT